LMQLLSLALYSVLSLVTLFGRKHAGLLPRTPPRRQNLRGNPRRFATHHSSPLLRCTLYHLLSFTQYSELSTRHYL
jgi:hypothetical protein